MMMRALRRAGGEFALADRAVAVFVELAEHRVGETLVVGAEVVLQLGLGDLAVAVGVELAEHLLLMRRHPAGAARLRLRVDQRAHRLEAEWLGRSAAAAGRLRGIAAAKPRERVEGGRGWIASGRRLIGRS